MKRFSFPFPICLVLLLAGCATDPPRSPQGSFCVKVVPYFGRNVRIYIHAYERVSGQRGPALSSSRVTDDGVTGFVLPLGKVYGASAYADLDGDGKRGPNDPAGSVEGLRPVEDVNAPQELAILTLPGAGEAPDWPQNKSKESTTPLSGGTLQNSLQQIRAESSQLPIPPPPVPPPPR
jgi:hypothetical protein